MDQEIADRVVDFYAIASSQIEDKAIRLLSLEVAGTAAAPNTAALYDGFSTSDTKKLHIMALQNSTVPLSWPLGKRFSKGLYFSAAAGTPYISGQYIADE